MSYRDEPRALDSIAFGIGKLLPVLVAAAFCVSNASASEICGPENLSSGIVKSLSPEGDVTLEGGPVLRLAGLHLPESIDLAPLKAGQSVAYGLLTETKDRWSRHAALVFATPDDGPPVWIQQKLVSEGKALIRPEANLGACWALLKTAEASARPRIPPSPAEAGRFARIDGRVGRIGEGRSVWFINVFDRTGQRITGVLQKRHMRRMKDGGVDVNALQGQTVRLRGARSIRNTGVIQLTSADQIEIVR